MSTASRFLIVGLSSLALASTALAEGDPETGAGEGSGTADPAAGSAGAPATPEAAPAPRYPRDVISRVLTYPKGMLALGLDLGTSTSSFFDPVAIRPLVGYGITDDIELNFAHYAFSSADAGKGSIDAGLGYKLLRGAMDGKLEVIARAQTGYSLAAEGLNPLALGVHVQYNITPKIAVITPGGQLSIGLADPQAISAVLPVGVGLQATPELYVQLDTTLANIDIKDSANVFIFADSTPIALTATYNVMPALDVLAGISLNLTPPGIAAVPPAPAVEPSVSDTIAILLGARYYIGAEGAPHPHHMPM